MLNTHLPKRQLDAVRLHSAAFKSDPFAARRMALHLRRGLDNPKEVHDEAERILNARKKAINVAFLEWKRTNSTVKEAA